MFSWFKSPALLKDLSAIGIDIHSHLIAGIDDGSPNLETSVSLIKGLIDLGYQQLYTTPHVMSEFFPNTTSDIQSGQQQLQAAIDRQTLPIQIGAAAEYFMDNDFEQLLAQKQLLTLPQQHILVEMSFISATPNLLALIFQLRMAGYNPILAHPERYLYMGNEIATYERLRDMGCKLQMNLLSLQGYYGKPTKVFAIELLKKNLIDFAGTDLHHFRHLEALQKALNDKTFAKWVSSYDFRNWELRE
jgi:protein-tyrosine phosphatase